MILKNTMLFFFKELFGCYVKKILFSIPWYFWNI
jgi:hypothetical protein